MSHVHSTRPAKSARVPSVRLIVFMSVVALPLLGVALLFARGVFNNGIEWRGDYADVNLKAMGNFTFNSATGTRDDVPARWRALDGKKVRLDGFMWSPLSAGARGTEFQFVYNIGKCCTGGPPQVQERVFGYAGRELPIVRYGELSRIIGTLHVRILRDDAGVIHSVFDMDVENAKSLD